MIRAAGIRLKSRGEERCSRSVHWLVRSRGPRPRWYVAALVPAAALAQREARDDEYAVNDPRVQHRTYVMEETGETIPYALFVPSGYDPASPAPLMVSLHGAGRQYDWLMNYAGLPRPGRAPRVRGGDPARLHAPRRIRLPRRFGAGSAGGAGRHERLPIWSPTSWPSTRDRIYLWGHSMGGAGTYYLASRYPDIWAGLAAVAGGSMTADYVDADAIRHIPFLVIQGSEDRVVPAVASARIGGEDARARDAAPLHRDSRRRPLAVHLEGARGGRAPVLVLQPHLEEDPGRRAVAACRWPAHRRRSGVLPTDPVRVSASDVSASSRRPGR